MSTQSESDFIEQFARVLLVQWCCQVIDSGGITEARDAGGHLVSQKVADACITHALEKGWVGKTEPRKVLAKGFATAAAFLKR